MFTILLFALVLCATPALAQDAFPHLPKDLDPVAELFKNAGAVAAILWLIIRVLKSPALAVIPGVGKWTKLSPRAKAAVLVVLGCVATAFQTIALGTPPLEAFLQAFTGLGIATTTQEVVVDRIVKNGRKKATPPAPLKG